MLVVSSLRGRKDEMERYSIEIDEFLDFSTDNFLESIDFDDLFVGIDDGDSLPDLDLGEFSAGSGGEDSSEIGNITSAFKRVLENDSRKLDNKEEGKHNLGSSLGNKEDQEVSGSDESIVVYSIGNGRKSSKNYHGKRKVKVDWTPELHRRFVEVVEQLGVDKAVPSRILQLMGIHCLTRHNIASHLQKYRSHRKHVLTREAEAKSWSQKRQMSTARGNSGGCKREMIRGGPWLSVAQPNMGFPPMAPLHHHFRPLHVWGHPPTTNQPPVNIWPKHVLMPPASLVVAPPLPTPDPSFWQAHQQHAGFTQYYFPPPSPSVQPPTRYEKVGVTGMHKTDHPATVPTTHPPILDFHPSKESIDAVIGDVLSKPCQPLPLGLKPPALDSVMLQLNRNGVPKVPPLSLHNT